MPRALLLVIVLVLFPLPGHLWSATQRPGRRAAIARQPDEELTEEELVKEYERLPRERFYRHASHLFDQTVRFSHADPESMSRHDKFMQAYCEGRWGEVQRVLSMLPEQLANQIYDKMLSDLNDRYTPILTLDDFFGLADAAPTGLNSERIRRLGLLLRVAVAKEQKLWLKRALDKGSRYLGRDDAQRLDTGRVLIHAEFDDLAREFLPNAVEASQIEDDAARREIADFWKAQEQLEEFQQTQIAQLWEERAAILSNPNLSWTDQRRAADRLADLLSQAPAAMMEPWIADLLRAREEGALELAAVFGRNAQGQLNSSEVDRRKNNLRVQKMFLRLASERTDISQPPWQAIAMAMADWWIREAEHTFENAPDYREDNRARPYVPPAELLDTAPAGAWRKMLPAAHQERIDVCLSKAVLVSDRYDEAVAMIADLADRNVDAGLALAEEYLKAWAHRHDPHVPEKIRRALKLPEEARIVVTPIMMEKNLKDLAAMLQVFRDRHVLPRNSEVLVDAFDICYSSAEVYQRGHIETVFGSIETMDEDILYHMLSSMTVSLASRWRNVEVQEEAGTRRTEAETLNMVRRGYQTALEIIDRRVAARPESWRLLTLAGSLLADWGDFEYYQQLVSESSVNRMEVYQEKNHLATSYFRRGANTYARQVPDVKPGRYSIEPYLAWFHALLGIGANGQMNVSKPLDRPALTEIRELVRGLPGDAAQIHVDRFARHITTRLEDVENPIHEDLKYKYLAGSLVITRESPFSFQTAEKVDYYDELLDELRLETRVDGPNTISREHEFGIILSVHHTEAMGRMADFGKYLVNDVVAEYAPSQRSRQAPATVYRLGEVQGNRDMLELSIREALSLYFDVKAIAFSPRDVRPRAVEQPGWQETVLAYILCKPKDASVDKIPRIQMGLEFLDLTGPVTISAESPETMIKVTDEPTPPRPFSKVDMSVLVDDRGLLDNREIVLELNATGNGLLPDLDQLVDLESLSAQLPITHVDPHDRTNLKQVVSWGESIHAITDRRWTVVLDAATLVEPARRIQLQLPRLSGANSSIAYQAYQDMDLVDLEEPIVAVGVGELIEVADDEASSIPWPAYVIGGGLLGSVLLLLIVLLRGGSRRERPVRARDVFSMPQQVDGFTVVRLLRALGASSLVSLNDTRRAELRADIEKIQASCFDDGDQSLSESELRDVARHWLKVAC